MPRQGIASTPDALSRQIPPVSGNQVLPSPPSTSCLPYELSLHTWQRLGSRQYNPLCSSQDITHYHNPDDR